MYNESDEGNPKMTKESLESEERTTNEIFKKFKENNKKLSDGFFEVYNKISEIKTEKDVDDFIKEYSIKKRKKYEQPILIKSSKSEMDNHFDVQLLKSL